MTQPGNEQPAVREVIAVTDLERDELLALLPLVKADVLRYERGGVEVTVRPKAPFPSAPLLELLQELRGLVRPGGAES